MAYTTDDLVADIQRDCYLPTAQRNFSPAQLLLIADQELMNGIAPMLVALDAGFFEEDDDQSTVAGQQRYDFSRYAMWNKLRSVELIDSDTPIELDRITQEQKNEYSTSNGRPRAFQFEHAQLVLWPPPDAVYTMRQKIYRRPGRMVLTSSAAQVSSVDSGTGVVTYTGSKPATFTSSSTHDFYSGTSPFRRIGSAISATASPGATQQTFSTDNAALLEAGDWVCVRDEAVFPAIPIELHPHLKDLVIRSISRTQGDAQQYQIQRAEIIERARSEMIAPGNRSVGQPKRISIPAHRIGGYYSNNWRRNG